MFSRKPKNIVSKVINLTSGMDAKQASHTWMDKDETRQARFGSTSRETFAQRRQADRERKTISRLSDSRMGTSDTRTRVDRSRSLNQERENIRKRFDKPEDGTSTISNPMPPQPESFSGGIESTFYPDLRPKL